MDVAEARAVLGVGADDPWPAVRSAYRRRIRAVHPDLNGGAAAAAARLNEAYAVLSRARRAGGRGAPPPGPTPAAPDPAPPAPPPPPTVGVALAGNDTLLLSCPPDEAFALLLDAAHRVGSVSYVDRACAIFEVVVRQDGEACSAVVTLQGRAHGTEAFVTLEALARPATLAPDRVVDRLLGALR
ncbi:MAG: J domain-containing protein [Thermoanaerobacterales bacterium]|nr:hypothetical protein [Thermoanaerobacterales bacterium]